MKRVTTIHQFKSAALTVHCNCFVDLINVTESQWGSLVPHYTITGTEVALMDVDEANKAQKKCLTCVFLAGANHDKCGKCIADLNTSFVSGIDRPLKDPGAAFEFCMVS